MEPHHHRSQFTHKKKPFKGKSKGRLKKAMKGRVNAATGGGRTNPKGKTHLADVLREDRLNRNKQLNQNKKQLALRAKRLGSNKQTPKLVALIGGSCAKSPMQTTPSSPKPPKSSGNAARGWRFVHCSCHNAFATCSKRRLIISNWPAPTMLISSIISHRHCKIASITPASFCNLRLLFDYFCHRLKCSTHGG